MRRAGLPVPDTNAIGMPLNLMGSAGAAPLLQCSTSSTEGPASRASKRRYIRTSFPQKRTGSQVVKRGLDIHGNADCTTIRRRTGDSVSNIETGIGKRADVCKKLPVLMGLPACTRFCQLVLTFLADKTLQQKNVKKHNTSDLFDNISARKNAGV
jgi:hypothetical protein